MDNHAHIWTGDYNLLFTAMFPDEPQLFNALQLLIYFSQPEPSYRTSISVHNLKCILYCPLCKNVWFSCCTTLYLFC